MFQSISQLTNPKSDSPPWGIPNLQSAIFYCLLLLFFTCSCEKSTTDPPPPPAPQIILSLAEEPYLTEIYLSLEIRNLPLPQQLLITRDDSTIFNDSMATNDTLVNDAGLKPATAYRYRAYRLVEGQKTDSSALLQVSTMDTTSHDFQWEVFTFGTGGSSYLRDVAIISPDNIWCVGKINASGGPYNAVHWDGLQWELKRIQVLYNGSYITPPLDGIFAFSENDIWVTSGVPKHWNGSIWTQYHLWDMGVLDQNDGGVTKIWGSSPNDIYFVGRKGTIVHYTGSSWQKLESGPDLPINDIWGGTNPRTGEQMVSCVASDKYLNQGKALLRIDGNQVTPLPDSGLSWSLSSVWFIHGQIYYIAGDGIYPSRTIGPVWYRDATFPPYYKDHIRGTDINDIVVAGSNGLLSHYNGSNWKHYLSNPLPFIAGHYYGVQINNDLIIAVGYDQNRAILVKGIR